MSDHGWFVTSAVAVDKPHANTCCFHELQHKLSIMQATYTPEAGLPHQYPPMVAQPARLRGRTHSMHQQAAVRHVPVQSCTQTQQCYHVLRDGLA